MDNNAAYTWIDVTYIAPRPEFTDLGAIEQFAFNSTVSLIARTLRSNPDAYFDYDYYNSILRRDYGGSHQIDIRVDIDQHLQRLG